MGEGGRPKLFHLPPYVRIWGWFGMRQNTPATVNWAMVENIVKLSFELAAPKSLSKSIW